jgi:hypothetical protein
MLKILDRLEFTLYATLPFATVLPAVTGTRDLLLTFPRLSGGLDRFFRIPLKKPVRTALIGGLAATAALALTPLWPDYIFFHALACPPGYDSGHCCDN